MAQKLAWRLKEIAESVGVTELFLRLEAKRGKLRTRKLGAVVIVLDADLKKYLEGDSEGQTNENAQQAEGFAATA